MSVKFLPSRLFSYKSTFLALLFVVALLFGLAAYNFIRYGKIPLEKSKLVKSEDNMCTSELKYFPNGTVDFRGFNNDTGFESGCYVIPDIVHLIKFNQETFEFVEMICIASILANHKPRVLKIHTNGFRFTGRYWDVIQRLPEFGRVQVVYLAQPTSIRGHSLQGPYMNWHSSDVARQQVLQTHGGIYLDSDVYVTGSLNSYRRFEYVVEWNDNMFLGTQILMAHKDARIIPLWLDTYKEYNASIWYYNAGVLPTTAVLAKKPELFHRVKDHFGTAMATIDNLYKKKGWLWKEYPAIHLFIRHQNYRFNEKSTLKYGDFPIRQMILEVMPDELYPTLPNNSQKD